MQPSSRLLERPSSLTMFRVRDGKIAEEWVCRDDLGMLIQLGVVAPSNNLECPFWVISGQNLPGPNTHSLACFGPKADIR